MQHPFINNLSDSEKKRLFSLFDNVKQEEKAGGLNRSANSEVLIVDFMNTFIRAFMASPSLNTNGNHTGGIAGCLKSIGYAAKLINPTKIVVVSDGQLICSASITNTGQSLTQNSIKFVNNKLNTELESDKQYICISDTDSMYIELGDLLKHRYPKSTPEDKDKHILELATEIQDESNHHLNALCKEIFNIDPKKHYFQLKQEVIAKGILVTGKRRYAMYITNKEGVAVEELDMKGIELMKSNMVT